MARVRVQGTFRKDQPIWRIMRHQQRSRAWLAERTGYSRSHIDGVAAGQWPATSHFQAKCAFALDLPEDMLFAAEDQAVEPSQLQPMEVA